ncbi:MAG: hypothetical protein JYX80_02090 [Candidatus Scalindua sediminis]|nr:hypothetical protein [Candidatus Scalindua sediminis]
MRNLFITITYEIFARGESVPEVASQSFLAGSILQIEPKCFGSGYKPEPAQCHRISLAALSLSL